MQLSLINRFVLAMLVTTVVILQSSRAEETPPKNDGQKNDSQEQELNRFFEIKIRPLLIKHCYECHADKKQQGELRVDHITTLVKGGENGAAIVPGKPEESLLIEAVRWDSFEMPPKGKLADREIELLEEWVRRGAYWPKSDKAPQTGPASDVITEEQRNWWAYQPVTRPPIPEVQHQTHPIDAFIAAQQQSHGFTMAPRADRATLARRLYFDLWGLPPTESQLGEFLDDTRADAYDRLIDRLLESPHYGEHWGRHWLDVVRYAESDGWRKDDYRPDAWRYRDYVVKSFNDDKPYNQFVREQLAGDEIAPDDPHVVSGTGFLHLGIYEYNQRDAVTQWQNIVDEITDVTGDVFLATGLACSRCHNHKFDTLFREDYYRIRSFFEPLKWEEKIPFATADELNDYNQKQKNWEEKTADIRKQMRAIEQEYIDKRAESAVIKFPLDVQAAYRKPAKERNSFDHQMAYLVQRQVDLEVNAVNWKNLKGDKKKRWNELNDQLKKFDDLKPQSLPTMMAARDTLSDIVPTKVPGSPSKREYRPGFLKVLQNVDAKIETPQSAPESSGRRLALANWIASSDNPLTPRVIVNRVWQYHFGSGIVPSPNDFGHLGQKPSHSDLLDWLATKFIEDGWSIKKLHKLIFASQTYQQSAFHPEAKKFEVKDPTNQYRWRADIRRLSAEEIRDAMLVATEELDRTASGPGLNKAHNRRSIYSRVMRNKADPFLSPLGVPDGIKSAPVRYVATTSSQALLLINGKYAYERAQKMVASIRGQQPKSFGEFLDIAFVRTTGKPATAEQELQTVSFCEHKTKGESVSLGSSLDSVKEESLVDVCHVLLNSSLFLYVE